MQILKLAAALPKNGYPTEQLLEAFPCKLPQEVRKNVLNLGVSKRYFIKHDYSNSKSENIMRETDLINLCSEACEKAIQKANLSTKDVGYFVVAYDVNPFLSPGLSQLLVRKIGFSPYIKHVNAQGAASTAFPNALELAENYLAAHPEDYVLLCISGVSSYWFQNQVRGIKDVAVRKIVEVTNLGKRDYLAGYARLSALNEPFKFGFHSHLDRKIPELGVKYTSLALKRLLGINFENTVKKAKKWAIHTGSEKILNTLAEHNGIQREKIRESHEILKEYGNLAGASLPFILERIVSSNKLTVDDTILMLGYGWGFSAAAAELEFKEQ